MTAVDDLTCGAEPTRAYPVRIAVTNEYQVWVKDHQGDGYDELVERLRRGDPIHLVELTTGEMAIDGSVVARAEGPHDEDSWPEQYGPWPLCPTCGNQVYPAYGIQECGSSIHDAMAARRAVVA